ncbi:MAG: sulfite exporter TauE/SafE family protein [Arenicellales bacterium]
MSVGVLAFAGAVTVVVGILIGAIGIGGVLLVPMLTYVLGISIHVAIATAMFSYLFTGLVGAFEYSRRGSINWGKGWWLCLGGMPGGYLGAMTAWSTPGIILETVIGTLVFLSGLQALRQGGRQDVKGGALNAPALCLIGLVTGFASAITGTGGPLVLVPLLLWLKVPTLMAVGLSQIIQIPIALLATGGNLTFGHVDFALGLGLSVILVGGVVIGARVAHQVSRDTLKRIIATALLITGGAMLTRVVSLVL